MRVAGFGFRSGASAASLSDALRQVEAAGGPATALATVAARADAPALQGLAAARGLPLRAVAVEGIETPTRSDRIRDLFGTGSVAEAAALAGAGPGATLIVGRITSSDGMATCAMATSGDISE